MKLQRLILKKARAIALNEFGTAGGLAPHENNHASFRCYEMKLGKHTVRITESERFPGYAVVDFFGKEVVYNLETIEEDFKLTHKLERERIAYLIRDLASCNRGEMFYALIEQYSYDECVEMLKDARNKCS